MNGYPRTLMEFERQFSTEKACQAYLRNLRWPEGFVCPRCQHTKAWTVRKSLYECTQCHYKLSVLSGTIFQDTHYPLTLWFRAIWWLTGQKNGASALSLQKILGLGSYCTAWSWLHKLRRAMVRPGREKLTGIVAVDESYVGGEKTGKRGRGAVGKALVFIAVEIPKGRIGRIRLQQIKDASAKSLEQAVRNTIQIDSTVHTDNWPGYSRLATLGYKHEIVHTDTIAMDAMLPACHRVAALLKRWLLGTHQGAVSHEHLEYYLDEFTFRFNRRTSMYRGKLFYRLLQNAVQMEPVPWSQIVKKPCSA
jgi:transposase-like protein